MGSLPGIREITLGFLMPPKTKSCRRALAGLCVSVLWTFVAGIPLHAASVALPAEISVEQAKAMAAEQGVSASSVSTAAPSASSGSSATRITDSLGQPDPDEGTVSPRTARSKVVKPTKPVEKPLAPPPTLRWGQSLFAEADPSLFASHAGAVGQNYTLGPGDQIILTLWGEKEARYDLSLDRDGQVRIELAGAISLNGQTLKSAEDLLKKRLSKVYSGLATGATQMDLTLGKLKQVRVYVVGDVVKPGSYLLSGNTSVFAALYQAQGPSDLGTERAVVLNRGGREIRVDLYDYLAHGRKPSQDVLQDGDILRVPRRGTVARIQGDVGRPGRYELLSTEGAKELLEFAGGVNATTASTHLLAIRLFPNGRREGVVLPSPDQILSGAKAPIQDGDSIQVFAGVDSTEASVSIAGQVRYPGTYPWKAGMTVRDLVSLAGGSLPAAYLARALVSRPRPDGTNEQSRVELDDSAASPVLQALDRVEVFDRRDLTLHKTVRISGAVLLPGEYEWKEGMTVKDLILRANGFRADAEYGRVRIETPLDKSRGSREEWVVLDSTLSVASADRPLVPGCHLSVPIDPNFSRLEMVEVIGWVAHPGAYSLQRSDERITEILARAGGVLPEGYSAGARLVRGEGGVGRIQVKFVEALKNPGSKHDLILRGGDTVVIPKRPATLTVQGRVNNPGSVIWTEGKSWKWYIAQTGGLADSAYEDGIYVEFADGSVETNQDGIGQKPDPGSIITVPFRKPPEPTTFRDALSGINAVLATVIAGLTIFVLLQK